MTWKYPDRNPIQPENEEKEMENDDTEEKNAGWIFLDGGRDIVLGHFSRRMRR